MIPYKLLIGTISFILLFFPSACSDTDRTTQPAQSGHPNILFISVDDLNDWVGFMNGHPEMDIKTPNLDRLASQSLAFTNAHTPAPACAPARTPIMTGVHPAVIGAENTYWGDGPRWREFEAISDVETMEQFFKNRGYTTLGGGKIYHSQAPPWTTSSQVEPDNWDFYYPSPHITHPYQMRPPDEVIYPEGVDNENRPGGMPGWWTWGPIDAPDEKMSDYHLVEWASYELNRFQKEPFFLAVGTWKPHDPWEIPQKYFDMYPLEDVVLPEVKENVLEDKFDHGRRYIHQWVLENDQWEKIVQSYAAAITFTDAMIGRLLDGLERSPYADNTIVILWSDHGMHMGEKENFEKFSLWELSTRVPFLIKAPGVTQPGSVSDQPVSLMDIYPTLVELTGFEIPDHLDGNSLVPLMHDPDTETEPVISSYRFSPNPNWHIGPLYDPVIGHTVRSKNYRYIYYTGIGLEELYDHQEDPNEWYNVAYKDEFADVVAEHRQYLLDLIPDLVWDDENDPEGYEVLDDGTVRKIDFIPMADVVRQ